MLTMVFYSHGKTMVFLPCFYHGFTMVLPCFHCQGNHDLKLLCHWLRANKLSLNGDKKETVIFRSKAKKITKQLNFRISGQKINPTTHLKYLGIYLDEYLNWEFHTNQIMLKLQRANCMLSKIRRYVPQTFLLSIYYSIFSSHMTYGCQVSMGPRR